MTKKGRQKQIERQEARQAEEQRRQKHILESKQCTVQINGRVADCKRQLNDLFHNYQSQNGQAARDIIQAYEAALRDQYVIDMHGVDHGVRLIRERNEYGELGSGPDSSSNETMYYIRRLAHSEAAFEMLRLPYLSSEELSEAEKARSEYEVLHSL